MKAEWTHLYSYRTQKLSTPAATIVGLAPAKIARCRSLSRSFVIAFFLVFVYNGSYDGRKCYMDILTDVCVDTVRLIPFLFITYLL